MKNSKLRIQAEAMTLFKLKCVSCGTIEKRASSECKEQPFCTKCYMPMTLEAVEILKGAKAK